MFEVKYRVKYNGRTHGYMVQFNKNGEAGLIRLGRQGMYDLVSMGIIRNVKCTGSRLAITGINGLDLQKLPCIDLDTAINNLRNAAHTDQIYVRCVPGGNEIIVKRNKQGRTTEISLGVV